MRISESWLIMTLASAVLFCCNLLFYAVSTCNILCVYIMALHTLSSYSSYLYVKANPALIPTFSMRVYFLHFMNRRKKYLKAVSLTNVQQICEFWNWESEVCVNLNLLIMWRYISVQHTQHCNSVTYCYCSIRGMCKKLPFGVDAIINWPLYYWTQR